MPPIDKNLVHRDVKPANILIADDFGIEGTAHIYLSDFGVAKSTAAAGLTKTGLFVGTADYASPEQIEGKQLDGRADVYSLGCVAYEVLTAAPAYDKDSEVAMMYAHLLEPPPKVTDKRPDLPTKVDEMIAKAVAKSKDDRYAQPTEFATAFKQALASGGGVGRRRGAGKGARNGARGASVVGVPSRDCRARPGPPPAAAAAAELVAGPEADEPGASRAVVARSQRPWPR